MSDSYTRDRDEPANMNLTQPAAQTPFGTLRKFIRPRSAVERCELCSAELREHDHPHLFDPSKRQILCACSACALLFSGQGATKYLRVPRRIQFLPGFRMSDAQWESLLIPINLAFFSRSTPAGRVVAMYPSPAGATESLLDLESWEEIVRENRMLEKLEPDVEAVLINRVTTPHQYFIVPIDECYKLVGLIRTSWRGLSGGAEVWKQIAEFFLALKSCAVVREEEPHA